MSNPFTFLPGDILLTRNPASRVNPYYQRTRRMRSLVLDQSVKQMKFVPTHSALMYGATLVVESDKHARTSKRGLRTSDYMNFVKEMRNSGISKTIRVPGAIKLPRSVLGDGVNIRPIDEFLSNKNPSDVLLIRIDGEPWTLQKYDKFRKIVEYRLGYYYNPGIDIWEGGQVSAFCSQLVYQILVELKALPKVRPSRHILPIDFLFLAKQYDWRIMRGEEFWPSLVHMQASSKSHNDIQQAWSEDHRRTQEIELSLVRLHDAHIQLAGAYREFVLARPIIEKKFINQIILLKKIIGYRYSEVNTLQQLLTVANNEISLHLKPRPYSVKEVSSWVNIIRHVNTAKSIEHENQTMDTIGKLNWRLKMQPSDSNILAEQRYLSAKIAQDNLDNAKLRMIMFSQAIGYAIACVEELFESLKGPNSSDWIDRLSMSEPFHVLRHVSSYFVQESITEVLNQIDNTINAIMEDGKLIGQACKIAEGAPSAEYADADGAFDGYTTALDMYSINVDNTFVALDWAKHCSCINTIRELISYNAAQRILAHSPDNYLALLTKAKESVSSIRKT